MPVLRAFFACVAFPINFSIEADNLSKEEIMLLRLLLEDNPWIAVLISPKLATIESSCAFNFSELIPLPKIPCNSLNPSLSCAVPL